MVNFELKKAYIKKIIQNKNFSTTIIIALFLLFAIDIFFIFIPEIKGIKDLNSKTKQMLEKIASGKRELADIDKIRSELEKKSKDLEFKEGRFASEEELGVLIEEISRAASDSDVKIVQIKPIRGEGFSKIEKGQKGVFIKVPILLQAVSNYHSLGKFVNKLESASAIFKVTELEMTANSSDYKNSNISMNLTTILKAGQ